MLLLAKRFGALALIFVAAMVNLSAQTMPLPYDLSLGNYNLTAWNSTNPAVTYPPNMYFHRSATQDPGLAVEMTTDYTGAYNLTSGSRFNGLGIDGLSMLNTGTSGNIGAVVLALNTTNRNSLKLSWNSKIILQGDRIYVLRLQYKVGNALSYTDVTDASGNPIQVYADKNLVGGKTGDITTFTNIELPLECENQPVVYLRWKYAYLSGSGARPHISIDDILVASENSIGVATNLKIANVIPSVPSSNFPFAVKVLSTDAMGVPKYATANTTVNLAVTAGNPANLIGTLSGVIPAGQYQVTFSNLKYQLATDLTLQANAAGFASDSKTISFVEGPSKIVFANLLNKTHVGFKLPMFTVSAVNDEGNPVVSYNNQPATLAKVSGPGNIVGTTSRTFYSAVATFDDITFDQAGTYVISVSAPGFDTPITATILVAGDVAQTEIFTPKYVKGVGTLPPVSTDPNRHPYGPRMPAFALIELDNLLPNTTYRYFIGSTDSPTYAYTVPANEGAGNNLHYKMQTDMFYYNGATSLGTYEEYSEFTTGANETKRKVWVNLVPTGNAAYNAGKTVYWMLTLGFEDGRFIKRFFGSKTSYSLDFGTDEFTASGIYDDNSWLADRTYLAFFNDTDADPVSTAIVQTVNMPLQTPGFDPQTPQFFADLEGVSSAWATYLPNNLASGVRRIAQYDWYGNLIREWTDADGIWAGVSTINPTAGRYDAIDFETPQIQIVSPSFSEELCNDNSYYITWNSNGVENVNIEVTFDGINYTMIESNFPARDGYCEWDIPRHIYSERPFSLRVSSSEHNYINSTVNSVIVWDTPIQNNVAKSTVLCQGESYMLSVVADGSDLTYQWFKDDKSIVGATQSYYELKDVKYLTSGTYYCIVTGHSVCPTIQSDLIEVYVATPTAISKEPNDANVTAGGVARFYAEAHIENQRSNGMVDIQWYKDGVALTDNDRIAGSRSNLLTIRDVQTADASANYYVVFNGLCPQARVESRRVKINLVELNVEWALRAIFSCEGVDTKFAVSANTNSSEPLVYEWYANGVKINDDAHYSGSNNDTLEINNVNTSHAGDYTAVVSIPTLNVSKAIVAGMEFVVGVDPIITVQPEENIIVKQGDDLNISVTLSDAAPNTFSYVWYKDGNPIAYDATFTKTNVNATDAGEYYVVVRNDCGETKSETSFVTITTKAITGVDDETINSIAINPNPSNGISIAEFYSVNGENVSFIVTDALGNEVARLFEGNAQIGMNSFRFDASNLNSGVYFLHLKSREGLRSTKFVVVK